MERNSPRRQLRTMPVVLTILAAGALLWGGQPASAQDGQAPDANDPAEALNRRFQELAERVSPSVVQVLVDIGERGTKQDSDEGDLGRFRHFFSPGDGPRNRGQGSGFMVSPAGIVVTNAHVVENATRFKVRLADGREVPAELVGKDGSTDLAALRIDASLAKPLQWGDSGKLKPGAIVFALGSPFGFQNSISQGIVSGLGRRGPQARSVSYVQTDAAINRGNSGGPLVDLHGRVVGVSTWIMSRNGASSGVGFAIPADLARQVVKTLTGAKGSGAWLGIVPDRVAVGRPVVYHVFPASPAARAGLVAGDRIVSLGGKPVDSVAMLQAILQNANAGNDLALVTEGGARSVRGGPRPNAFKPAWRQKGPKRLVGPRKPLGPAERAKLAKSLQGCDCPCPCGRTLANCFGCSAAKSEFSEGERLIRLGLAPAVARRELEAPVMAWVWFDYTDPKGRALLRALDGVEARYGSLFRVRRRYFPASPQALGAFREAINTVEVARAAGHYERAHALMIAAGDAPVRKRLQGLIATLGLRKGDVEAAVGKSRFEAQISKDLTAGPQQFGVTGSPFLQFRDRTPYMGKPTLEEISKLVEKRILAGSL
jgi:serine protease Do